MNDKQRVISRLNALPDTATLHDIREEFEILDGIKLGQKAAQEGRVKSQREVEELFASWSAK